MPTAYAYGNLVMQDSLWDRTLTEGVVNDGNIPGMDEEVSTIRYFRAIGRHMILGKVAVDYPLCLTFTMVLGQPPCSACTKVGYRCLPQGQEKER